ncbi:MAG: phosphodiester glycosidase family protein [Pirellula sp.]
MRQSPSRIKLAQSFVVVCALCGFVPYADDAYADDIVKEKREFVGGKLSYLHLERKTPRPLNIHVLKMDLTTDTIEWKVIVAKDPDGDGPAESELTSPFQLANQSTGVLAVLNTNPWNALPEENGKPAVKPNWFPGRPVDISGLAASGGKIHSMPQPGYVSIWRTKNDTHEMGALRGDLDNVEEGFGGFQQIVSLGKRIANSDTSLHPRTGVGFDKDRGSMWFVVVDGRQAGFSEGMTTVELADFFLDLGCWDASNLDGGGSSILGLSQESQKALVTANRPSDRVLGGFSVARPLPMVVVLRETSQPIGPPENR